MLIKTMVLRLQYRFKRTVRNQKKGLNMIELIPSKDVREFIIKTERIFNDFEKAVIINNLCLSYEEKRTKFVELKNTTKDEKLRKQLDEHMKYQDKCLELYAHKDTGYVYLVKTPIYEDRFGVSGCFTESDLAYFWGKKTKKFFIIEKYRLVGFDDFVQASTSEDGEVSMLQTLEQSQLVSGEKYQAGSIAVLRFDKMGELLCVYSQEDLSAEKDDLSRFEHAYVDIPNPFDTGDQVRIIDEGKCGVVCTSQGQWQLDNERWKKQQAASFEDIGIMVRFCENNGIVEEESINPLFLERYVFPEE